MNNSIPEKKFIPLVSVIIPVYNVEKYLSRCVESVINQTYKNIEIILVDDGSPDNCPKLCDEYAEQDSNIKVIHKKNGGLSSARNAGLEIATGDYITFLDSDDWIENDMYEKLVEAAKKNDCDFIISGIKKENAKGEYEILQYNKTEEPNYCLSKNEVLALFRAMRENQKNAVELHAAVNKFLKADFISSKTSPIRFDEKNYGCEDGVFSTSCFNKADSVCIMNESLYCYFYNDSSICHNSISYEKIKKLRESRRTFRLQTFNFYKDNNLPIEGFIKYMDIENICDELFYNDEKDELKSVTKSIITPAYLFQNFNAHKILVVKLILYKMKLLKFLLKIKDKKRTQKK